MHINGPFTTGKHLAIVGRLVCHMFHMCEMEFSNTMFLSVDTRNPAGCRYRHTCLRIDNVITTVEHKRFGCLYKSVCVSIIMYADDIILLSPSVTALQKLLHVCEGVLQNLDLFINPKKSICLRIGPRYNMSCCDIVSSNGCALQWVESVRYLVVYFVKARQFKCRYDRATASFYRAFNAVFGKIGKSSSEEVVLQLISSKCMPCLLYALEACPINKTQEKSLEFTINRVLS